ncbi:MAG: lipopolysaccharide biosynthesis protein [Desulfococcaceae bacterium]
MSRLKSNFMFSALAVCINAAVSLSSVPYITRRVSPSDYGHISLFILFFYLFAFVDGIRPVIINSVHHSFSGKSDFFRSCHIFSWLCGAVLSVLTFILLILFYHHRLSAVEILFISLCALFCVPMNNEAAFLEAGERVGFIMMVRSAGWVLFYASFIVYASVGAGFECYAMSVAGMNGFLLVIYRAANSRESRSGKFRFAIIREMMTKIRQGIMFNLYSTLMSSLDRLFISKLLPLQMLAHYSVQYEFGFNWNTLVQTAGRVLYPHLSRRMAAEPFAEILAFWVHMNKLIFFAVFSITLAGAAFSEEIIGLYAGAVYTEHHYIFRFVMIGVAISALGVMAVVFQRAQGDFASQEKAYGIGALTGILLVYPLVKTFGILGAALVYLAVRIADILLVLKICRNFFRSSSRAKYLMVWPGLFVLSYLSLWYEYYAVFWFLYAAFGALLFNADDIRYYVNAVRYPEKGGNSSLM